MGLQGEQSGLWYEMLRLVRECRPQHIFIENVDGAARRRYVPFVREDLWRLGYSSVPIRVRAEDVGAPFRGSRIFILATKANGDCESIGPLDAETPIVQGIPGLGGCDWGPPEASTLGVDDGIPHGMDRLRALGNAVVPAQAREAFARLREIKCRST
jgi:DNA (cytosine-5)-methyltransferase 1